MDLAKQSERVEEARRKFYDCKATLLIIATTQFGSFSDKSAALKAAQDKFDAACRELDLADIAI